MKTLVFSHWQVLPVKTPPCFTFVKRELVNSPLSLCGSDIRTLTCLTRSSKGVSHQRKNSLAKILPAISVQMETGIANVALPPAWYQNTWFWQILEAASFEPPSSRFVTTSDCFSVSV